MQRASGTPYYTLTAVLHAGGRDLPPVKVIRRDIDADYRMSYMDNSSIHLSFPMGTVIYKIAPFQDDLKITLTKRYLDSAGKEDKTLPLSPRTYRAYVGQELPRSSELSANPGVDDEESGNRKGLLTVSFDLEEVAVEQLRKQTCGIPLVRNAVPWTIVKTLLSNATSVLKLDINEVIKGIDIAPANNNERTAVINIPDGTPILDLPDYIQNEQGGIYSTSLGFYINRDIIHLWPLYDAYRQQTSKRLLRVIVGTSKHSKILDKTYTAAGRTTTILTSGFQKVVDKSQELLNKHGNAVRFTDAASLFKDFGKVVGNKLTINRGKQNSEYASTIMGNGQNNAQMSDRSITSNVFLEASKMALRNGAFAVFTWRRSEPELLTPDMSVEILYDSDGEIKTIEGALIGHTTSYETEGEGPFSNRWIAITAIRVFVDRNDPDYIAYLEGGGVIETPPEVGLF